ncbi:hypothetical protein HDV05_002335 [Chytridiales sp. JEL 0842]|nr:hypothetical protein HDV05_002335 [Chytridiales sp. JEL 0842]
MQTSPSTGPSDDASSSDPSLPLTTDNRHKQGQPPVGSRDSQIELNKRPLPSIPTRDNSLPLKSAPFLQTALKQVSPTLIRIPHAFNTVQHREHFEQVFEAIPISRWSARFVDPDVEAEFLKHSNKMWLPLRRIMASLCVPFAVAITLLNILRRPSFWVIPILPILHPGFINMLVYYSFALIAILINLSITLPGRPHTILLTPFMIYSCIMLTCSLAQYKRDMMYRHSHVFMLRLSERLGVSVETLEAHLPGTLMQQFEKRESLGQLKGIQEEKEGSEISLEMDYESPIVEMQSRKEEVEHGVPKRKRQQSIIEGVWAKKLSKVEPENSVRRAAGKQTLVKNLQSYFVKQKKQFKLEFDDEQVEIGFQRWNHKGFRSSVQLATFANLVVSLFLPWIDTISYCSHADVYQSQALCDKTRVADQIMIARFSLKLLKTKRAQMAVTLCYALVGMGGLQLVGTSIRFGEDSPSSAIFSTFVQNNLITLASCGHMSVQNYLYFIVIQLLYAIIAPLAIRLSFAEMILTATFMLVMMCFGLMCTWKMEFDNRKLYALTHLEVTLSQTDAHENIREVEMFGY